MYASPDPTKLDAVGTGMDEPLKPSTSCLIILPPSPVPATLERSIPFSLAIALAKGLAFILSEFTELTTVSCMFSLDSDAFSTMSVVG